MLADRYDLPVSTASTGARDAYVQGCDLALNLYPGAMEAFDSAIVADPGFALAHVGKALWHIREANMAAARDSVTAAKALAAGLPKREASHIAFFDLLLTGQTDPTIAAARAHLNTWPRDAVVLSIAGHHNGPIGASGRVGQKREIAVLLDQLAPRYGDDGWFLSYHAMGLVEDGRCEAGRVAMERSMALNRDNAYGAHSMAHVYYESGDPEGARDFLKSWLATYPRDGIYLGHLNWHLALVELELGDTAEALRLCYGSFAPGATNGPPPMAMIDTAEFLWRWELAGYPRDHAGWRKALEHANRALPRPGNGIVDTTVVLAQAVMRDDAGLEAWVRQMEDLAREGRYPPGPYLPALARAFAAFERRDFPATIDALEPFARENERIGGSRAQHDLVDFTLLKAYLNVDRLDDVRRMLRERRPGPSGIPIAGLAAVQ
jgi:tetratricopeptide (TPR) repeat protein